MRHHHAVLVPIAWLVRSRLGFALLVALGLLMARPALATEQSIVFDFDVELSHQPTHICVVSTAGSRTGRFVYSLPFEEFRRAYDAVQRHARYDAPSLTESLPGTHEDMQDAIASLGPISEDLACEAPHRECNPRFEDVGADRTFFSGVRSTTTTRPLHVVCGHNSAHADRRGKVLLLSLNFMEEDDVPVTQIRLDGNVAAMTLARRSPPNVVARVVGGHYVAGRTHVAIGGRMQLPLDPLCVTRTVALPKVNLEGAPLDRVVLHRDGKEVRRCAPSSEVGKLDMVVAAHEGKHRLEVRIGQDGWLGELETRWTGRRPQEITPLSFTEVTFAWAPDCAYELYPDGHTPVCPGVRLGGGTCENSAGYDASSGLCLYTCSTSATFELPAAVSFSRRSADESTERWDGRLDFPGQILRDYLPVDQRRARLDFGAWTGMPLRERARIRGVSIRVGGRETFIDLSKELFDWDQAPSKIVTIEERYITIPRSSCRNVQYEVIGDRRGKVRTTHVEHGVIVIDTAESVTGAWGKGRWGDGSDVFLGLSVGHMSRLRRDEFPPTGLGDGLDLRLGFMLYIRPWKSRGFMDSGAFASAGTREYVRVDSDLRELRAGAYARVGVEITGGVSFPSLRPIPRIDLGLGGSHGFGFVLLPGEAAGMRVGYFLGPHARLQVGPVALYLRFQFLERLHELQAGTGERLAKHRAIYSKLELQYRFDPVRFEGRRRTRQGMRQR
jgi:hypothetical protein